MKVKISGIKDSREVFIDGRAIDPAVSRSVRNHSPTGFNWGYYGDGPAQLALGILLEFTDESTALEFYRDFKEEVIEKLPEEDFEVELDLEKWLQQMNPEE